jgi:outer membrane protein OmpA-like peptidoglycan-associated protein
VEQFLLANFGRAIVPLGDGPVVGPQLNLQVTFGLNSAELTPGAEQNLQLFADTWKRVEETVGPEGIQVGFHFVIVGHTDATGPEAYNMSLSWRRAEAVVNFLTAVGLNPAYLVPQGLGETDLAEPERPFNEVNRRVVVTPNIAGR